MTDSVPGVPGGPEERTWTIWECAGCDQVVHSPFKECKHCGAPAMRIRPVEVVEAFWRERSRGLEEALRTLRDRAEDHLDEDFPTDLTRNAAYWTTRDDLWEAINDAEASLSAVPDVQNDDDGYEARPASPVPAGEGPSAEEILESATALAERYGEAILRIRDVLHDQDTTALARVGKAQLVIAGLAPESAAREGADVGAES